MNGFSKAKVFVSGGAGVIGTPLVLKLYEAGAKVFVGDLKPRPKNWPSDILYREGDLNTISKEELLDFGPTYYFHLAATFERSEENYEFWQENHHHNILLSHHLLNCLKDSKTLKKVIFASSYLVYDPQLYLSEFPLDAPFLLNEESPMYPRNLCGLAKQLHERELAFIQSFRKDQFTAIAARIFRSYGRGSKDVISRWVRDLIEGKTITVFRPEGMFDFVFADDAAEGLMRLSQLDASGIVNLGRGEARRISDVIDILKNHFREIKVKEEKSNILFEASQADMALFQDLLKWSPQHTLEQGIAEIVTFERGGF